MRSLRTVLAMIIGGLVLITGPSWAEVDVDASLARDTVAVGETVELTIVVTGAVGRVAAPQVPQVDYLQVVASGSQQSISFINGRMNSTNTYTFTIRPTRAGTYTIPPITVHAGGEILTTRPLTLTVTPGATSPPPATTPTAPDEAPPTDVGQPAEELFARLEVDNDHPWVGEQVTMTLRFYQSHYARLLDTAEYTPPRTEGLIAEPLPDPPTQTIQIQGVPYEVVERRTALFAPQPGEYTIGPASINFVRSYLTGEETITTEPVTLTVRPLPTTGRSKNFSGVVGRLKAELSATADSVRVGEALTVRLEITGTGDLRQLEAPELNCGNARVYSSGQHCEVAPEHSENRYLIGGKAVFEYLVMPTEAGTLTIAPVEIQYFDPGKERYVTARTAALHIEVLPGEGGETTLDRSEGEICYLKESSLGLRARPPITSHSWFWLIQLVPLGGLSWALRRRTELLRRAADPRYRRFTEAATAARRRLRRLSSQATPREVYEAADEALTGYVADKTGVAAASLSPSEAVRLLDDAGCSAEVANEVGDLLSTLRAGVYAPGATVALPPDQVAERIRTLVERIEGELR